MAKIRTIDTLTLDGGAVCFDFINTVYAWRGENLHEYLQTYDDVIAWCKKVNILEASQRINLSKEAKAHPVKATKALQQLKETRDLLYHFFSAIAANKYDMVSSKLITGFNLAMTDSFSHLGFTLKKKRIELQWNNAGNDLLEPLWVVLKSAYDILTTDDRSRIKECPKCGWVFMDKTKNNKRRWCNPSSCGSTEKSKKYYQKIRTA